MEFIKNIKLSFLVLVLLILLPVIVIIVFIMAIHNYNESYDAILGGFDKKLLATSSITASFVDADEHSIIATPKYMGSFSYDNKSNILYGMSVNNKPQKINLKSGGAIDIDGFDESNLSSYIINDIAIDSLENTLYASTYSKELLSIDLNSTKIEVIARFDFVPQGVAYSDNRVYISSNKSLYSFNIKPKRVLKKFKYTIDAVGISKPKSIETKEAKLLKTFLYSMDSLSILDNKIYGVDRANNQIFKIDIDTLEYSIELKEFLPDGRRVHHLGVDSNHFYMGVDNLMVYERNSSTLLEDNFGRLYRDDTTQMYLKYIKPMTEIKKSLNLTYHYTFNLLYNDKENNCFYIMDVNYGGDYTPIGSYDTMDKDDLLGAENVMLRDETYVSAVKLWEKWGLLKVAYAGIKDKTGKVVAITGTDVDVSIINIKTRDALIQSIIIGILALIIGIYASYFIAIKIIRPIEILKYSALKIAAGNYGDNISIQSPQELNKLSIEFNNMSNELKSTVENFGEYKAPIDSDTLGIQLQDKLNQSLVINNRYITIEGLESSRNLIGMVEDNNLYYIYSLDEVLDTTLDATKKRAVINNILLRLLQKDNLDKFIDIFKPKIFSIIDIANYNVEDILTKDTIDIGESKEIEFEDIKVSIANQRILS